VGYADDLRDILSTGGIAATKVFAGELPAVPHEAVGVIQTLGLGSLHTFGSSVGAPPLENLRMQVMVRSSGYAAAETLMTSIHMLLDGLRNKGMNGHTYKWIEGAGTPYFLGLDDENRPLFACNYTVKRSAST
jgi:hypothetical protein